VAELKSPCLVQNGTMNARANWRKIRGLDLLTAALNVDDRLIAETLITFAKEHVTFKMLHWRIAPFHRMSSLIAHVVRLLCQPYSANQGRLARHRFHTAKRSAKRLFLADISANRYAIKENAGLALRKFRSPAAVDGRHRARFVIRGWKNLRAVLESTDQPSIVEGTNAASAVVQERKEPVKGKHLDASIAH
jgi:hypothetical protein